MGVRRVIPIFYFYLMPEKYAPDFVLDIIGLCLSLFMFFGMMNIRPLLMERKQAEDKIRLSEDKFRYMFDNSVIGKSITFPSGEIHVNKALCEMLGYSPEELQKRKWQDITHTDDIQTTQKAVDSLISGEKESMRFIKRYIHKNGSIVWADVATSMRRDEEGKPLYFITSVSEITERKQAEEEFQALSSRQDAILAAIPDIIMEVDADKIYRWANRAGLEFFGEDVIGKEAQYYFEGEHNIYDQVQPIFIGNEDIIYIENRQRRKDGQKRLLAGWCRVLKDNNGKVTGALSTARDITERKQAEEELLDSEMKYRSLTENSPDLISRYDRTYRHLYVNEAAAKAGIYSAEEHIGKTMVEVGVPAQLAGEWERHIRTVFETGQIVDVEDDFEKPDGLRYVVKFVPEFGADGSILSVQAVARDITERKRAEENERHLNAILSAIRNVNQLITKEKDRDRLLHGSCENLVATRGFSSSWILTLDGAGRPATISESGLGKSARVLKEMAKSGYLPQCAKTALERPGIVIVNDVLDQCAGCPVAPGYKGNAAFCVGLEKDGKIYGILCASVPHAFADDPREQSLFQEIGEDIAFALYNIELEERRRVMEKELKDSEARYRALFEGSSEGILITEISTKNVKYANPAFCQMVGYSDYELKDMGIKDLHSVDILERIVSEFEAAEREGRSMNQHEIPFLKKNGTIIYADTVASHAILIDGISCSVSFITDVTMRKNAEDEKKRMEEQLWQANKMEAIGRLTGGGIAHDFNNMLTTILGNAEMALLETGKEDPLREPIEDIKFAGEKAAILTRQLLAFSRRQILQAEIFNLNEVVSELDRMLGRLIGENIELETSLSPGLGMVETDPGQVEQIIMNLAVNARDAMPEGGRLTIETASVELDEKYAASHFPVIPGHYEMLSVSDTGVGMSKEIQSQIFDPFFTTKAKGKGTGLGLAIVYGIVKQSNGYIWVYSEPGNGATFKIYLPRVEKADDGLEKPDKRPQELFGGKETIMVAEDDAMIMKMIVKTLTNSGYTVLRAGDGNEALRVSDEYKGPIHLVLTDVIMPGMGGRELADRLHETRPDTKILYMSGYTDNAIVHHGILEKGLSFIQKPFTSQGLKKNIREVMG